jgi:hypothetical protein
VKFNKINLQPSIDPPSPTQTTSDKITISKAPLNSLSSSSSSDNSSNLNFEERAIISNSSNLN